MGLLAKSVIAGVVAGTALVSVRAVPLFLDWRRELADRVEVVAVARDVAIGHALAPDDLKTVPVAAELAEGSALREAKECLGRSLRCAAPAGAVLVRGCLAGPD